MIFTAGTVTIDVPNCPYVVPNVAGVPSWVVGWGMAAGFVLLIALIVAISLVRYGRNEEKTRQMNIASTERIQLERDRKICRTCGSDQLDALGKDTR